MENQKKGRLPKNFNEIIKASLKTIDLNLLQIWLQQKNIKIKIGNKGNYKFPNESDIMDMIIETIQQKYFESNTASNYFYGQNIDTPLYFFIGGIAIFWSEDHFIIDFRVPFAFSQSDRTKVDITLSFKSDLERMIYEN